VKLNIRAIVAIVPLVLCNAIAVFGQLSFIRAHVHWPLIGAVMFALSLESIAVFLAYHAHLALVSNDSALKLRLASYGMGLLIGILNYSHYSHKWRPTFEAVAVGMLSAISPWLWAVHSRRESRDALMHAGLIEPHAVRLGATRVMWHPVKSARVMYAATWLGETNPREAIALIEPGNDAVKSPPVIPTLTDMATKADAVRFAIRAIAAESTGAATESTGAATDAQAVAAWLRARAGSLAVPAWEIPAAYVRDVARRDADSTAKQRRSTVRAISAQDSGRAAAGT